MIALAEETFAVHNDPSQLSVDENVLKRLRQLHEATISELCDNDGPTIWVLLIPTTTTLMNQFLQEEISETELLDNTPLKIKYDSIYLCSAMTLDEYRKKGLTKKLTLEAIEKIRKDHPIKNLFVWSFSEEGKLLARKIAASTMLPLFER
jgi:hypothetical protein